MAPIRVLSDEQFNQLSTDQKYLYINEMLFYVVASRPGARSQSVEKCLERVAQSLTEAGYARLPDPQKIQYLESLISELIATVREAQRHLGVFRVSDPAPR